MGARDALQLALEALAANKLRASLTMLGIVIGVGAVIALMAVGQGSQKAVTDRIEGLGTNLLFIRPGATTTAGVRAAPGSVLTLSQEDAAAIAAEVPDVVAAVPQSQSGGQLIAGGNNTFASIAGVTPQYTEVTDLELASGFFFTDEDVARKRALAEQLRQNPGHFARVKAEAMEKLAAIPAMSKGVRTSEHPAKKWAWLAIGAGAMSILLWRPMRARRG